MVVNLGMYRLLLYLKLIISGKSLVRFMKGVFLCNVYIYICICMCRCLIDYREVVCCFCLNENNDVMNVFYNVVKSYKKSNFEGVFYVFIVRDKMGLMVVVF